MLKEGPTMEDMLWKFPHVWQQIFKKLSNKNLAKCKKVAKTWEKFITNENFYKQKVHYETKQKERLHYGRTYLNDKAGAGGESVLKEFKLIFDNVEDKSPKNDYGRTPLHFAAGQGNLEICKYIVSKVENKQCVIKSKDKFNQTPIDFAERNDHQEIVNYLRLMLKTNKKTVKAFKNA